MVGMIQCFMQQVYHRIILMPHQRDITRIWTSLLYQMVKHGEMNSISRLLKLKHKDLSTLEQLNIKKIPLPTEPLITMMDTSPHMLTWPKTKLENGTKIYCGMLDQLRIIEKELQMDILSKCNLRKTIKLGKKHGRRK